MKTKQFGLMVFTNETCEFDEWLDSGDFYAEYNFEFGFYFFPEEVETYDDLEVAIAQSLDDLGIHYRIEGVF